MNKQLQMNNFVDSHLQNVKSRIVRRVLVRVSARDAGSPSCPIGDSVQTGARRACTTPTIPKTVDPQVGSFIEQNTIIKEDTYSCIVCYFCYADYAILFHTFNVLHYTDFTILYTYTILYYIILYYTTLHYTSQHQPAVALHTISYNRFYNIMLFYQYMENTFKWKLID